MADSNITKRALAQAMKGLMAKQPFAKISVGDICEACGKPYIVQSGLQKYCPECAKTVVPETVREHKREYMAEHSEELNAARGEKRKKSKEK